MLISAGGGPEALVGTWVEANRTAASRAGWKDELARTAARSMGWRIMVDGGGVGGG